MDGFPIGHQTPGHRVGGGKLSQVLQKTDSDGSNKSPSLFQPAAAVLGSSCGCSINRDAAKI